MRRPPHRVVLLRRVVSGRRDIHLGDVSVPVGEEIGPDDIKCEVVVRGRGSIKAVVAHKVCDELCVVDRRPDALYGGGRLKYPSVGWVCQARLLPPIATNSTESAHILQNQDASPS